MCPMYARTRYTFTLKKKIYTLAHKLNILTIHTELSIYDTHQEKIYNEMENLCGKLLLLLFNDRLYMLLMHHRLILLHHLQSKIAQMHSVAVCNAAQRDNNKNQLIFFWR